MPKFVVATDFSRGARRTFYAASKLMPRASFKLFYAFNPVAAEDHGEANSFQGIAANNNAKTEQLLTGEIDAIIAAVELGKHDKEIRTIAREGKPYEEIVSQIDRDEPELLVVGVHDDTGEHPSLFSTKSANLVRTPPCDILVYPTGCVENLDRWANRRLAMNPD